MSNKNQSIYDLLEPHAGRHDMAQQRPLTEQDRAEIIKQLKEVQAANTISDAKMAGLVGCNSSVLSQIKRGIYTGNTDKYLYGILQWLQTHQTGELTTPDTDYVATSIGQQIRMICDMAVVKPAIGIIRTPSGWGKTAALKAEAASRGNRCLYIQAGELTNSCKALMNTIRQAVGLPTTGNTGFDAYRAMRNYFSKRYMKGLSKPYLLIIDEATTLRATAINTLRNFHDDDECRLAVVLADTATRLDRFLYGRSKQAIIGGNEQLRSRAKAQFIVTDKDSIKRADVKLIADAAVGAQGYAGKLSREAVDYLCKIAQEPGALRNVTSRIENVAYLAARLGCEPTYDVSQLDYVAKISGEAWQLPHTTPPFGDQRQTTKPNKATKVA